jgi:hypothetical protein
LNETIFEINSYLQSQKYIHNDVQFSKEFLKKSPKYISMIRATGKPIKESGIIELAKELKCRAKTTRQYSGDVQRQVADQLDEYSNKLISDLIQI